MTRQEALALCDEMVEIVGQSPGVLYQVEQRIDKIEWALQQCDGDAYFREKLTAAVGFLRIWRSPRKWQQWGSDPSRLHSVVLGNLSKLRSVIMQQVPE